jgi:hypothetical protein
VREERYAQAVRSVGDDKVLYGHGNQRGVLELTDGEHMKFIATLNRSRKRDRQRRQLMMRLEAAMPGGHLLRMTDDATVEHILPRGGSAWWNQRFPDSALRAELANLLGNLTLITYDQNKRADNRPYSEKRTVYFDTAGAPLHGLTKDIAPIGEWTLQVIEERHEKLVRILCEDLGLIRAG